MMCPNSASHPVSQARLIEIAQASQHRRRPRASALGECNVSQGCASMSIQALNCNEGRNEVSNGFPDARFIAEIDVAELMRMQPPREPVLLELLARAKLATSVRIVNGLKAGNLTRALAGEPVGTLIRA